MKKILSILFILLPVYAMAAVSPIARIWTVPEKPKSDAEVTIYFDVTGTDLENSTEPIYLWAWYPTEPDAGHWNGSSEFARLTQDNGNVWKITMVPATYFKKDANLITEIYGLLKNKTGTKQTDAFAPDKGNAIALDNTPSPPPAAPVLTFFPLKLTQRDIFYISRTNNEKGVTGLTYTIKVGNEIADQGNFDGANAEFTVFINLVDKLAKYSKLDKFHISITDNNGKIVSDTDYNLVVIQ